MTSPHYASLHSETRLRAIVAVCCLVAVAWTAGVVYLGTLRLEQESRKIVAQAAHEAQSIATTDAILLQRHFDALGTLAKLIARQRAPVADEAEAASPSGVAEANMRLLNLELTELVYGLEIAALLILDASGNLIAHGSREGQFPPLALEGIEKELVGNVSAFAGADTVVFNQHIGEPTFYIARVISQGATTLGSVIVATTSQRILETLQHGIAHVIVADANGVVVAAQDTDLLMKTVGPPDPALLTSSRLLERYGRNRFDQIPASFLSEGLDEVRASGTVHAHQEMSRSTFTIHVAHPVRELSRVERANMLATTGLVAFGLLSILLVGFALHHLGSIRDRAAHDALTGLSNRDHADQLLPALMGLHDRGRVPGVALVAFDLDRFKDVNDTWGHTAGDRVLQRFAEILMQTARRTDHLFRVGGEEFLAVLVERDIGGARAFAQRVLNATREIDDLAPIPPRSITASAGVTLRRQGETLESAISRADELLYAAKENGRDCVKVETT